jgi:hypothetical protein
MVKMEERNKEREKERKKERERERERKKEREREREREMEARRVPSLTISQFLSGFPYIQNVTIGSHTKNF